MKQLIYISTIILTLFACKPIKKVQKIDDAISRRDSTTTIVVVEKPKVDSLAIIKDLMHKVSANKIHFSTFSAKVKVEYKDNDGSNQAKADIRILKDSLIWVSLTGALGIEGMRLKISKDSMVLINKLNKTIQYGTFAQLQEIIEVPFDFNTLQDLVIGNPIFVSDNIISYKDNNAELLVLMWNEMFKHLITLSAPDYKITHSKLDDVDALRNRTCDITYAGYENIGNISFSTKRRISFAEKSKLDVDMEFKQVAFNQSLTFPFSIPKNFKSK